LMHIALAAVESLPIATVATMPSIAQSCTHMCTESPLEYCASAFHVRCCPFAVLSQYHSSVFV